MSKCLKMYKLKIAKKIKKDCKKARKKYQSVSKKEKEKKILTKIPQKIQNKSLLSIKKIFQNENKCLITIIRIYYFKK